MSVRQETEVWDLFYCRERGNEQGQLPAEKYHFFEIDTISLSIINAGTPGFRTESVGNSMSNDNRSA